MLPHGFQAWWTAKLRCATVLVLATAVSLTTCQAALVENSAREATFLQANAGPRQHADALIATITNISSWFREAGVEHMFFHGTALGLHRDGGVIEGDDDVDVLVRQQDMDRIRQLLLDHNVYDMYYEEWNLTNTWHGTCFMRVDGFGKPKGWAPVDIYADVGSGDYVCDGQDNIAWPRYLIYPPQDKVVHFGGKEYRLPIPRAVESWLQIEYGAGWKDKAQRKGFQAKAYTIFHEGCTGSCDRRPHGMQKAALCFQRDKASCDTVQIAYLCLFIALTVADYLMIRSASERRSGLPFSIIPFIVLLEFGKLLVSMVSLLVQGGMPDVHVNDVMHMMIPAALYSMGTYLYYASASRVVLTNFATTMELQVIFAAICWLSFFGRHLTGIRVLACALVSLAVVFSQRDGQAAFDGSVSAALSLLGLPAACALCMAIFAISCEHALKLNKSMSIDAQACIMSCLGVLLGMLALAAVEPSRLGHRLLADCVHHDVQCLLLLKLMIGLLTPRILKYADCISLAMASSVSGPVAIAFAPAILHEPVNLQAVLAAFLTFSGGFLYSLNPGTRMYQKKRRPL
eukprot:TRINITY_DN24816_c0_g1_i2.p1 TRINITY_DN24816_c0_g1~~TRINITY_DN24816_c0_g1_i2.p1  ORF type:complete len:573 (+),score=82.48 TRINITY_DN24816_c0_g1_i2:49-1767(+)